MGGYNSNYMMALTKGRFVTSWGSQLFEITPGAFSTLIELPMRERLCTVQGCQNTTNSRRQKLQNSECLSVYGIQALARVHCINTIMNIRVSTPVPCLEVSKVIIGFHKVLFHNRPKTIGEVDLSDHIPAGYSITLES
jgi:hypothetical protein